MIIDLCCGQGRFESDNEEVISIDINPETKPTICADIKHLPLRPNLKPRFVHASPTCTYFSKARRWGYGWNPQGIAESLELVAACFRAFAYLGAENCSLEKSGRPGRYSRPQGEIQIRQIRYQERHNQRLPLKEISKACCYS